MAGIHIQLTVRLHQSPLDARRDVVRVHSMVFTTLGMPFEGGLDLDVLADASDG